MDKYFPWLFHATVEIYRLFPDFSRYSLTSLTISGFPVFFRPCGNPAQGKVQPTYAILMIRAPKHYLFPDTKILYGLGIELKCSRLFEDASLLTLLENITKPKSKNEHEAKRADGNWVFKKGPITILRKTTFNKF